MVAEPGSGPGRGPRMLNVPSQAFPAPGSQQRVASQGRSKVSGDAVVRLLQRPESVRAAEAGLCRSTRDPASGGVASLPQAVRSGLLFFTVRRTRRNGSGQRDFTARSAANLPSDLPPPLQVLLLCACDSQLSQHCLFCGHSWLTLNLITMLLNIC